MTFRALASRIQAVSDQLTDVVNEFEDLAPEIARKLLEQALRLDELRAAAQANIHRDPLPPAQARVLEYIRDFLRKHGMAPTRGEIAKGLGLSSPNAVQEVVQVLARKGAITLIPGQNRGIRINGQREILSRKRA